MSGTQPAISVVTVTWNSADTIEACVAPLAGHDDIEIVVVDNDSADDTLERVARAAPDATVVQTGANCGFAVGVNAGVAAATGDTVILLNPDGAADADGLRRLAATLSDSTVAAPRILDGAGAVTRSVRAHPTVRGQFAVALGLHKLLRALDPDDDFGATATTEPLEVPVVSGACFAIPTARFRDLGGLDERFFLYGEEVDFCLRVAAAGGTIRYQPSIEVSHIGGVSAEKTGGGTDFIMFESRVRLFAKHRGRLAAHLARLALLILAARRRDQRALSAMRQPMSEILAPRHPTLDERRP